MKYGIISSLEVNWFGLSFWQTQIWSKITTESWQVKESFYYGNKNSIFLCIEIRSIGLWFFGAFALWVTAQQITEDWDNYIVHLSNFLKKKWIIFIQIEPLGEIGCHIYHSSWLVGKYPYKKFLTPYTRTINLLWRDEEILEQMHEKWRYNIRSAIKKWVEIERVLATSENIDIWMSLLDDTLSRDGFSGNSRKYYEIFIKNIETQLQWWLYFARFEWRVIAAGIFVFETDRAIYYYGASSSDSWDKKVFAPYLLQWEVMKSAKKQWIPLYDLLWISEPGIENDALAGVSFFKSRFGWQVIRLPQKILFPLSWKYNLFLAVQKIKNLLKRR